MSAWDSKSPQKSYLFSKVRSNKRLWNDSACWHTSNSNAHVVRHVAREVDGLRSHLANVELLVVFQQLIKDALILGGVDAASLAKETLHTPDALADRYR